MPTPLQLSGFFFHISRGGPTARLTGALASAVAWVLLVLAGCLRFAHVQRSHSLQVERGLLKGVCAKGKRRVGKVRPPFSWAVPARVGGFDLGAQVILDWNELLRVNPDAIPDLVFGKHAPLCSATVRKPSKMGITKFAAMLQAIVAAVAPAHVPERPLTSYALRRFLPTAADVLLVPSDLRDAIGNWTERPSTHAEASQPAGHQMAVRYAHNAADTAKAPAPSLPKGTLLSWDNVRSYAPAWHEVESLTAPNDAACVAQLPPDDPP